jgi:prevent-host-death family protein
MVMNKSPEIQVRVAALKARLSEYLRLVRQGQAVVVYDRDTPVARLVPLAGGAEPLACRPPERPLHDIPLPPPLARAVNSLQALREERQPHR